ncbi:LuxR C-terminal-related transcriptional regulator [Flavobacterium sp.]|uniref:helix-turn-helix transcriptional regulator n=1 Tax=Flavobacterium sp. TaxID=239 RepID=UPI003342732F
MSYKVLIYSCDTIFQIGISLCVKKSYPNVTIYKANTLEDVFATDICIDLLVFDVLTPADLFQINERILDTLKEIKVVFFVEKNDDNKFSETKDAIFLKKDIKEYEVIKRLRLLCLKRKLLKNKRKSKNILKDNALSKRELQCFILLMKGNSVSEISKQLSLRMSTVSTYKRRIHNKTNTKNVIQLLKKI